MINPKELLFTVDENNQPIQPVARSTAHKNGVWHRSANVWVLSGDKVLCQKRSAQKDTNPGKWEACFGGHLGPEDTYLTAAKRETAEELGIQVSDDNLQERMVFKYQGNDRITGAIDNEYLGIYSLEWSGDLSQLRLEVEEVEKVDWRDIDELKNLIGTDSQWIVHGYEQQLLKTLSEENDKL